MPPTMTASPIMPQTAPGPDPAAGRPASPARPARVAGLIYLLIIVAGITSEFALRGPMLAAPDPLAMIAADPGRFRLSLLGDLVMLLADVTLALLLYGLLRKISGPLAQAAMVFRLIQAALIGAGLIWMSQVPVLALAGEAGLAGAILGLHATGYDVALAFFGVTAGLTALLLRRGGAAPGLLVAALAGAGVVYVTGGVLRLVAPGLSPAFAPAYLLPVLAETGLALWLLIVGRVRA